MHKNTKKMHKILKNMQSNLFNQINIVYILILL